jgi:RsiW-degrading membrane proteinase PrsW (M82 family)
MKGLWFLLLLIFISALPLFPGFLWFRRRKIGGGKFFLALAAGLGSVLIAAVVQSMFPPVGVVDSGPWQILRSVFFRIALVEELSRLAALFLLLKLLYRASEPPLFDGAALGLAAGLGFAVVETAMYAAADIRIALLRALTAAPLHSACGSRIGIAASLFGSRPPRAVVMILSAAAIHAAYDFMLTIPGILPFLSVPIALAALGSSLLGLRHSSMLPDDSGF